MEGIKRIKKTSFIASIFFLGYILLILLSFVYPYYSKNIPYFDYLDEYESGFFGFLNKDHKDDLINLIIPAFFSIVLFSVSILRTGAKRVLSRNGSLRVLIFSVIILLAEYFIMFIISEKGSLYNEVYNVDVYILMVMFVIPFTGEILLAVSCAYEIMYCEIAAEEGEKINSTDRIGYRLFLLLSVGFIMFIVILYVLMQFV